MNKKGKFTMSFQRKEDETVIRSLLAKQLYILEKDIRALVRDAKPQMRQNNQYIMDVNFSQILQNRYFKIGARINYNYRPRVDVEVFTLDEFDSKEEYFDYVAKTKQDEKDIQVHTS